MSRHSRAWACDARAAEIPREKRAACSAGGPTASDGRFAGRSVAAVTVAAEAEVETGFYDVFGFIYAVDESELSSNLGDGRDQAAAI